MNVRLATSINGFEKELETYVEERWVEATNHGSYCRRTNSIARSKRLLSETGGEDKGYEMGAAILHCRRCKIAGGLIWRFSCLKPAHS